MRVPDISVVIATYNRAEQLKRTLDSLAAQETDGLEIEVLVVENNCTDHTAGVLDALVMPGGIHLRRLTETRQGNAYARNTGAENATASVVAFTDDDVRVSPGWARTILETFARHPEVTFVGGPVLPDESVRAPSWLTRDHWAPIAALDYGSEQVLINETDVRCLLTANFAIRHDALNRVGPFAPSLQRVRDGIGSLEDHDLILRLCRAGEHGMYLPAMIAVTDVTPERMTKRYHRRWHSGHGRFYARLRDRAFEQSSRSVLGVPGHVMRTVITSPWTWLLAMLRGRHGQAFLVETQLRFASGFARERIASPRSDDSAAVEPSAPASWGREPHDASLMARTLSAGYLVTFVELVIGLFMLPFNASHLGPAAYGLWIMAVSPTAYFSMLDLGYGASLVKFVTQYRARRDSAALNELASTMFVVFAIIGIVAYAVAILIAFNLTRVFDIGSTPAATGRQIILIVSVHIALGFPVSVYGGIVNGFQRRYLNGMVAILTSLAVAAVNIVILLLGYGVVAVVLGTTIVRCISIVGYRSNAYRVFPSLRIRLQHFRRDRLREITRFSSYMFVMDLANKLNYASAAIVIGAVLNTTAVAIWTVGQRLSEIIQRLTDQLNAVLFPVVVDSATRGDTRGLQRVLFQGTRLSLAMVLPLAIGLALLAEPLVLLWVGPGFLGSVVVTQLLAAAVAFRVGSSSSRSLLVGSGDHALVANVNVVAGVTNVVLSVMLARVYGLAGVALGTVLPMGIASVAVLFPAACRRANVRVRDAFATAVWPSVWPAMCMACVLLLVRNVISEGAAGMAMMTLLGGVIYLSLFFGVAISRQEREWYLSKAKQALHDVRFRLPLRSSP